jgi:hypothetical protein
LEVKKEKNTSKEALDAASLAEFFLCNAVRRSKYEAAPLYPEASHRPRPMRANYTPQSCMS